MRIPYTNIVLGSKAAVGLTPERSEARGKIMGLASQNPSVDMRGYKIDAFSLFSAWRANGDVFACVNKIKNTACMGGYRFIDPSDVKGQKPARDSVSKEIMDIITSEYGTFLLFKERVFDQFLISGNCYIEKVRNLQGRLIGLKVLDSRTMAVVTDEEGNIYRYVQSFMGGLTAFNAYDNVIGVGNSTILDPVIFEPNDIIHWKLGTDPNAEAFGFSPMEPVLWEIRTDLSAMLSNYYFFENDATPSVQYILEPNLSKEEKEAVVEFVKKQFKGSQNRHKSAVVDGVKEIKTVRISQKDMEYLQGRQFSTEKICAAYSVPKGVLGYINDVTFANMEAGMKEFYEGTVRGHEQRFEQMIFDEVIGDSSLVSGSVQYQELARFVITSASFDTQAILWERAMNARVRGIVTTNEARRMIGMEPLDQSKEGELGDRIVMGEGNMSVLLEDVGTDPLDPEQQQQELQKRVAASEKYATSDVKKPY